MFNSLVSTIRRLAGSDRFCLLVVMAAAAAALLMIPLLGIPAGRDLHQHLQFAGSYREALAAGDFFPGWAGSENHGFGSVGIRFYPPLAYYLLALTDLLTGSLFDAFWLNCFFWMLLGAAGAYWWVRESTEPAWALLAAVLYALAPFHLFQIYQALLYGEFAASGLLPFCFLFLSRLIRRGGAADVVRFSVCYSLLVLTHLPLTIIGTLALAVYGAFLIERANFKRSAGRLAVAGLLSLAATAFYWLRVVTEVGLVAHSSDRYSSGQFDFRQYLFPLYYSMGEPVWHFDAPIALALLMLAPLAVYLALGRRGEKSGEHGSAPALLAAGAFSILMMSVPSAPVWNALGFLQKIQFPWRWLSVASLLSAAAFAAGLRLLGRRFRNTRRILTYAVIIVAASFVILDLAQNILTSAPLSRAEFALETEDLTAQEGCPCWLPAGADRAAYADREKVSARGRTVSLGRWESERREFEIGPGAPGAVRVATFAYPHWRARVNGAAVPIAVAADGAMTIDVPETSAAIELYFEEPVLLRSALPVSLTIWLFFAAAVFYLRRKARKIERLK
jgi:hypothetical protein